MYLPGVKGKGHLLQPPPYYGSWDYPLGMGIRKKKQKKSQREKARDCFWEKQSFQQYSNPRSYSIKFINKPLSKIDILKWVKHLRIKHFRGVFSRDDLPTQIYNLECAIINLDSHLGPGSHWVCYRNIDKEFTEFFDHFGLPMAEEILEKYFSTSGKQIIYSRDEIQKRNSVLCGYCVFTS